MDDSEEDREEERLLFSREQGFFDRNKGMGIFILLIFAVCLFIFLHFKEVKIETLELNSMAKHYVIAQVDFDFPDEEATIIMRQRVIRDVETVNQFHDNDLISFRNSFEKKLLSKPDWRKTTRSDLDQIHKAMDLLENALIQARFTNLQTINKMKDLNYSHQNYYAFLPESTHQSIYLPDTLWDEIRVKTFSGEDISPELISYIIHAFEDHPWHLEEDEQSTMRFKKFIQMHIPEKYTKITVGKHIIDQGDRVTGRHISMMQSMKEALSRNRNLWSPLSVAGSILMTLVFVAIGWVYFSFNHKDILASNRKRALLVTIVILTLAIAKLVEALLVMNDSNLLEEVNYPLFVPFGAVFLCALISQRVAIFTSGFLAVVMSMSLAVNRTEFLVSNLITAIVVILYSRTLHRRKEIFWIMGKAWLACIVVIVAFSLTDNGFWEFSLINGIVSSFISLLITAILVVGLLPVLESTFHVLTDIILIEYMNPNGGLLRRLAIEAPGTYQHSMVVGHLSEAAARSIGANSLFCRVSALYHDIGKLNNPQYFTENQQRGMDIHQLLTSLESAQVIIAHVSDGVLMARKAGLPESFIDIIKEHHGTTLVYFFYCKQKDLLGDKESINEKNFRYSGPKPRTKESAIIMLADTLEAASRSLDEFTKETITILIDKIIQQKARDGQFNECLLTFEELGIVRRSMIKTLVAATHSRIKYPHEQIKEQSPEIS